MTQRYLYRNDNLTALRKQATDPWLRARRIRQQPMTFPHRQLGDALAQAKRGDGVFRLSMWRTLEWALTDLQSQLIHANTGEEDIDPLILQRIPADQPLFERYLAGDDQHLPGQAWLFWRTETCNEDQDWSSDGIPHADIEVFHPAGYWAPFDQVIASRDAPPAPSPGWTRLEIDGAFEERSKRTIDARWVDHPSMGRCIFARVPVWTQAVWPTNLDDRSLLGSALFAAFPELVNAGQLIVALERTGYTQTFDVTVARVATKPASWLSRVFKGVKDQPAWAYLDDAQLLAPNHASVEGVYEAAGVDQFSRGAAALVYGHSALVTLQTEAASNARGQDALD